MMQNDEHSQANLGFEPACELDRRAAGSQKSMWERPTFERIGAECAEIGIFLNPDSGVFS